MGPLVRCREQQLLLYAGGHAGLAGSSEKARGCHRLPLQRPSRTERTWRVWASLRRDRVAASARRGAARADAISPSFYVGMGVQWHQATLSTAMALAL